MLLEPLGLKAELPRMNAGAPTAALFPCHSKRAAKFLTGRFFSQDESFDYSFSQLCAYVGNDSVQKRAVVVPKHPQFGTTLVPLRT